jgi:hypothetical protein
MSNTNIGESSMPNSGEAYMTMRDHFAIQALQKLMGKDYRPRMIALLGIEEWRKRQREQLNRWRAKNPERTRATSRRNRKK